MTQHTLFDKGLTRTAFFCSDRKNRFHLSRMWDADKPCVAFIGLNPSTANEYKDDNTIKKVMKIADHNGFGSLFMLNLFPIISSNPDLLYIDQGLIHINNLSLIDITSQCHRVVFCWGNFKQAGFLDRDLSVKAQFPLAYCIEQNKNGSPKHPLYCKDNSILKPYRYG